MTKCKIVDSPNLNILIYLFKYTCSLFVSTISNTSVFSHRYSYSMVSHRYEYIVCKMSPIYKLSNFTCVLEGYIKICMQSYRNIHFDFRCRIVNLPPECLLYSKHPPSEYLLYSKPPPRILYYIVNISPWGKFTI